METLELIIRPPFPSKGVIHFHDQSRIRADSTEKDSYLASDSNPDEKDNMQAVVLILSHLTSEHIFGQWREFESKTHRTFNSHDDRFLSVIRCQRISSFRHAKME
jgi:hypothetical protein